MITASYSVNTGDLRSAMYYPYLVKYRRSLIVFFFVLCLAAGCFIFARLGLYSDIIPLYFVAAAYLIWMLITFGRAETSIRSYLKNPLCLVGKTYDLELLRDTARFQIRKDGVDETVILSGMNQIVDMRRVFLFHTKGANVYIVPKRAFSADDLNQTENLLQNAVKERYTFYRLIPRLGK